MTFMHRQVDGGLSLAIDISLECWLVARGIGGSLVAAKVTSVTRRANHGQSA